MCLLAACEQPLSLPPPKAEAFMSLHSKERSATNMADIAALTEAQVKAFSTLPSEPLKTKKISECSRLSDEMAKAYAERPAADKDKGPFTFKFLSNRTTQTTSRARS